MYRASFIVVVFVSVSLVGTLSFRPRVAEQYISYYRNKLDRFTETEKELLQTIQAQDLTTETGKAKVKEDLAKARMQLKGIDFWLRYLEPIMYKRINGPLPVEWETEVFEKFERPYKREGAGLTLAELYLEEDEIIKDSLLHLIQASIEAKKTFQADSITVNLNSHHHFFLANRLFILNLAAIYTTGFECPEPGNIIPELLFMLQSVKEIYSNFDQSFTAYALKENYLKLYNSAIDFVGKQNRDPELFDHFTFIKDYVNPLFALNQQMIREYKVISSSFNDYTLNDNCNSIFDKTLYRGQDVKGIYYSIDDEKTLAEIKNVGRLLFYDPILSGNNKRSCASCHNPTEYFNDTATATDLNFDGKRALPRNTPTLINTVYNHLLMLDGKHISLEGQARDVTTNPDEMGGAQADILKKVLSCGDYNETFKGLLKLTPGQKTVTFNHIASAITLYYSDFSKYQSSFDRAMNQQDRSNTLISKEAIAGFNIFMSKAQCATCHFVPLFNGVKPPYVGSEFEVIGVPEDTSFKNINKDSGRYNINPAKETLHAFRTGSIRNAPFTKPYMHNGVFKTLEEVIDFYDAGGGVGRGLAIDNQTLSSDSLKLTIIEKKSLIAFIGSLNEDIRFEAPPQKLPSSRINQLNQRKVGGEY